MAVIACTIISTLPDLETCHVYCFATNKTLAIAEMELELAITLAEEKASMAVQNLREEQKGLEELIPVEVRVILRHTNNITYIFTATVPATILENRKQRKFGYARVRIASHSREKYMGGYTQRATVQEKARYKENYFTLSNPPLYHSRYCICCPA